MRHISPNYAIMIKIIDQAVSVDTLVANTRLALFGLDGRAYLHISTDELKC